MSDPLRTDPSRASEAGVDAEREAKIEQLLLLGLDQYFSASYEQAINIWTRVLFLDRSHARARAYIDRARTAIAEGQRETEELVHRGLDAFARGESGQARRLLQTALGRGASSDEALAALDRLDRLESAHLANASIAAAGEPRPAAPGGESTRFGRARAVFITATVLAGLVAGVVLWHRPGHAIPARMMEIFTVFEPAGAVPAGVGFHEAPLPLPRRGETALARAQALHASGRLHDALAALDGVQLTDPERSDADRLRAEIQRQLFSLATSTPGRVP